MKKRYRNVLGVVFCSSKRRLRTESWKDLQEILKSKLETIEEDPGETVWMENRTTKKRDPTMSKRFKKAAEIKRRRSFSNFTDSYTEFMTMLASKLK
ncbi:hypothetical protein NC651_013076 [Populus alba x Populus x berolinensis]|nr:hypothetical protein NC651_013076 [Populus alba x Populus x berolinensis]